MKCPFCGDEDTIVKDSRPSEDATAIRRRRFCAVCGSRFTTFERIQLRELVVVKRNGTKKVFDREKMLRSVQTAVRKRAVSSDQIDMLVNKLIRKFELSGENEIKSAIIGEEIMSELSKLDQVAYVRFASVYKDFSNYKDFLQFIERMKNES